MPRLFIAIELSDEVKRGLGQIQVALPGARWVPREQLHLTLAFLGNQDEVLIGRLEEALMSINEVGFGVVFETVGAFPDSRRPRVIWAGIKPERCLERLAERVQVAVSGCGIVLEERLFWPHISLARIKTTSTDCSAYELFRGARLERIPAMDVKEFILYESRLTAGGAIHTPLKRFPLICRD